MLKLVLMVGFLSITSVSWAQKYDNYFLKKNGQYVDNLDSADYERVVSEPEPGSKLFNILELYKNKKKKLVGKSLQIDPPIYEGQVVAYFENGQKKSVATYSKGKIIGLSYDYYPNGLVHSIKKYPIPSYKFNEISIVGNYSVIECYDSLGKATVTNGNGYYMGYDDNFTQVREEGKIKNGKRDSIWKGTYPERKISFIETYKDGELLSGIATDEYGIKSTYSNIRESIPTFKVDQKGFFDYLYTELTYPPDFVASGTEGFIMVQFLILKDGNTANVGIKKSLFPSLDIELVKLIERSKKWTPATKFGRPVEAIYTVTMEISSSWNNK